jgi:chemotaxis methyl-accepting protein methylase
VKDYPFFGFDRQIDKDELAELHVANKFKDRVINNYDEYINSIKTSDAFYRDINTFYQKETGLFTIHYHYTYIKKKLYRVLMLGSVILDIYDVPETKNRIPIAVT